MSFNPDLIKQAEKIMFTRNISKENHPHLVFDPEQRKIRIIKLVSMLKEYTIKEQGLKFPRFLFIIIFFSPFLLYT